MHNSCKRQIFLSFKIRISDGSFSMVTNHLPTSFEHPLEPAGAYLQATVIIFFKLSHWLLSSQTCNRKSMKSD